MSRHATFYCSDPAPLTAAELHALSVGGDIREERRGLLRRDVNVTVRWPGATMTFKAMPERELADHLAGFVGFVRSRAPFDTSDLQARIRGVRQVIAGTIDPGPDEAGRSEALVAALAARRGALVVREDGIFDEQLRPAVRPSAPRPRPAAAPMGEPLVLPEDLMVGAAPQLLVVGPPDAARVLRRALALAAIGLRGQLENPGLGGPKGLQRLRAAVERHGVTAELEAAERALLAAPVGSLPPQVATDATWRAEGLVVLTWALGLVELPPHDRMATDDELLVMAWLLGDTLPEAARALTLRPPAEIDAMAKHLLGLHWRLVDFRVEPRAMDFVAFSHDCWFGSFDLRHVPIVDGDLAIGGVPIAGAEASDVGRASSIAVERHRAINWLRGDAPRYADVDVST